MNEGLLFALSALLIIVAVIGGYLVYLLRRGNFAGDDLFSQSKRAPTGEEDANRKRVE